MAAPSEDVTAMMASGLVSDRPTNKICHADDDNAFGCSNRGKRESKQLLYPETFGEFYKEEKLQILGNKKSPPSRLITEKIPQSSVLSQIKAFLPELSKANASMAEKMKSSNSEEVGGVSIECVDGTASDEDCTDDAQRIEMNLSLVPSELLLDSSDESSDEPSTDEDINEKEGHICENNSSSTATSSSPSSNLTQSVGRDDGWLQLPQESQKTKRERKALIEEVLTVDGDGNFTNR